MSVQATGWAMNVPTGSPRNKVVLLNICNYADELGFSWPSYSTIARQCDISTKSVRRAVDELIDLGLIEKSARYRGNNSQTSNTYAVNAPFLVQARGGDKLTTGGDTGDHGGGTVVTTPDSSYEPSLKEEDSKKFKLDLDEAPPAEPVLTVAAVYSQLREIWPKCRRAQISKPRVISELAKIIKAIPAADLLFSARRYREHRDQTRDGGKFTMALLRWLKDEIWRNTLPGPGTSDGGGVVSVALVDPAGPPDAQLCKAGMTWGLLRLEAAMHDWQMMGVHEPGRQAWIAKWGPRMVAPPGEQDSILTLDRLKAQGWTLDERGLIRGRT